MTIERRRHPRFPLLVQITVQRNDEDFVTELLDLSRSGARLDLGCASPPWVATKRAIEIHLPSAAGSVALRGTVVRLAEEQGRRVLGLRFERVLDETTLTAITRAAEDPAKPPPLPRRSPPRAPAPPPPPNRAL
ncbi:MAG: PilZ domain-containing protein [Sandaracinaceae bacterium]